jgi:D-amino-acid oxidase
MSLTNAVPFVAGFCYESVMIHVPVYLRWLYATFLAGGGIIRQQRLRDISEAWADDTGSSRPDIVMNCCGLGASQLGGVVDDSDNFGVRGQTVRVRCPAITDIWRVPTDGTYVLPRGDGDVILGGTHVKNG